MCTGWGGAHVAVACEAEHSRQTLFSGHMTLVPSQENATTPRGWLLGRLKEQISGQVLESKTSK